MNIEKNILKVVKMPYKNMKPKISNTEKHRIPFGVI